MILPVYIGYDSREPRSMYVARRSLIQKSTIPTPITQLDAVQLAERGLLRRPQDARGQRYDIYSNAYASTEFAISRFLVPILQQQGWALFVDSDVVFMGDVADLVYKHADPSKAVLVVKHQLSTAEVPLGSYKMDGQRQQAYARKNWSSVMLFNCDHPANKRLSLVDVQERRGLDLHSFYWLADDEIGELPAEWNWLVGVQEKPEAPRIAHFTLGTPELGISSPHDDIWYRYAPPPEKQTAV